MSIQRLQNEVQSNHKVGAQCYMLICQSRVTTSRRASNSGFNNMKALNNAAEFHSFKTPILLHNLTHSQSPTLAYKLNIHSIRPLKVSMQESQTPICFNLESLNLNGCKCNVPTATGLQQNSRPHFKNWGHDMLQCSMSKPSRSRTAATVHRIPNSASCTNKYTLRISTRCTKQLHMKIIT